MNVSQEFFENGDPGSYNKPGFQMYGSNFGSVES